MEWKPASIILQDQTCFQGFVPDWQESVRYGEVVFTTGMTGYPESLTDPSYAEQILTFTYPLIGNYGVADPSLWESRKIHANGVVVNEACQNWSHSSGQGSLLEWLRDQGVALISQIDTRALTKHLRFHGSMPGAIVSGDPVGLRFQDPNQRNLVAKVTCPEVEVYGDSGPRVICIDCGMKENILRHLCRLPITVVRVPYDYDFTHDNYDAIFISNGPGDPTHCSRTVEHLRIAMKNPKPIFGICLGTQLLALAAGAKTFKLPFGHRGHNQPCIDTRSKACYVTSQNHGFAIDPQTLPEDWTVSFRNLNDGTVEGIAHCHLPFYAVQFHPEAAPGPTDTRHLFDTFFKTISNAPVSL